MMNKFIRSGCIAATLLASFASYAGDIRIGDAWSRATAPGQDAASVDMTITSKKASTLVGVSTPVAKTAELHSMTSEGGMMRMREVESIELPAGKRVNLGESGYHLMLNGLKEPLKAGGTVPLTLTVEIAGQHAEKIETRAEIRPLTAAATVPQENGHMQHHH